MDRYMLAQSDCDAFPCGARMVTVPDGEWVEHEEAERRIAKLEAALLVACDLFHSCLEWDNGGERDYGKIVQFLNDHDVSEEAKAKLRWALRAELKDDRYCEGCPAVRYDEDNIASCNAYAPPITLMDGDHAACRGNVPRPHGCPLFRTR